MSVNCIAIDDDPSSLENLHAYLTKLPDLQLVKSFTDPLEAFSYISTSGMVDIIFMDIEMPSLSGIELATLLRPKTKHLIFTTAHAKYAIDAFKVNADAYLLKPYSMLHFAETINNLYPDKKQTGSAFNSDFFYIPYQDEPNDLIRIYFNDLISLEQINDTLYFRTIRENYTSVKLSFNKMLNMLRKHPAFIQVNSTSIISKLHVKSLLDDQIVLSGGIPTILTGKYKESFLAFVKQNLLKSKLVQDN
jgi:DNA-binding LytR/AlgR family response regulator